MQLDDAEEDINDLIAEVKEELAKKTLLVDELERQLARYKQEIQKTRAAAAGSSQPSPGSDCPQSNAANVARPSTTSMFTRKKPAGTSAAGVSTSAIDSPQPKRQRKSTRSLICPTPWRTQRRSLRPAPVDE
jgi:hypothetical protein